MLWVGSCKLCQSLPLKGNGGCYCGIGRVLSLLVPWEEEARHPNSRVAWATQTPTTFIRTVYSLSTNRPHFYIISTPGPCADKE